MADPVPRPGQALVKTLACGICGTDLHFMKHGPHMIDQWRRAGAGLEVDLNRDIVLGHGYCGEIIDYGPTSARPLKVGSRVIAFPPPWACRTICRSDLPSRCCSMRRC